jgi:hypothetical protein
MCFPLIHLGYHKTATTWLQNAVFSDQTLGFISPWGGQAGIAVDEFVLANPFRFDAVQARSRFEEGLAEARRRGLVPVLSNEALCGQPVSGGRFAYGKFVVERLRETFPDGKILIVVREQRAALLSHYREYIANGFYGDLARFIGGPELPPGFAPDCPLDHFEYDALVGHTQALFGPQSVLVLPFEMLQGERERFLAELYRFAGRSAEPVPDRAPERVGVKGLGLAFKRGCNRLNLGKSDWARPRQSFASRAVSRAAGWVERLAPDAWQDAYEEHLRHYIEAQIGTRYARSNAHLEQLTGLGLGHYGYALPSPETTSGHASASRNY